MTSKGQLYLSIYNQIVAFDDQRNKYGFINRLFDIWPIDWKLKGSIFENYVKRIKCQSLNQ